MKNLIDEHNHPPAPADLGCLLRSHRKFSDAQKGEIIELGVAGIRKHQIFEIMEMQYGGYDKVGYKLVFLADNKVKEDSFIRCMR